MCSPIVSEAHHSERSPRYRYRSFNPAEDTRLAATDAIPQVAMSAGVLVSLQPHTNHDGAVHNVRSLLLLICRMHLVNLR